MENHGPAHFRRPTFSPRTPRSIAASGSSEGDISTLPDLIRFNAHNNPRHIFALQSDQTVNTQGDRETGIYDASQITFEQLDAMVNRCAGWIRNVATSANRDTDVGGRAPIAIYLESGVGLFLHLAAVLSMDIPVLLISIRLSPPSVLHLLKETGAKTILVSQRTKPSLSGGVNSLVQVVQVEPYSTFMAWNNQRSEPVDPPRAVLCQADEQGNALILHSSGTTGLPKPIFLTHRYLLGYAACHQFTQEESTDWVNLSTLPLYHGFGLLAPCLSLSIGMTTCFPPPSIIPAVKSTLDLVRTFNCRSLMTVPSIIDDILSQPDENERNEAFALLAQLEFLAVGGGALKQEQGAILAKKNIKLLNHYGVTEIGAIAPIFSPKSDYDWRFLRLRSDIGLELQPIQNSTHFRLVGHPIGWGKPFEVQDELERNEASSHVEVRILGRTDDVIVLKNGEKIQPRQLEDALNADPKIRVAVCVGNGFFELAVIIDPMNGDADDETTIDQVWELLSHINPSIDHHARITSKRAIIVKPKGVSIPRSDKGSIMRQAVHEVFQEEIKKTYASMELDSLGNDFLLDPADIETGIKHLLSVVMNSGFDSARISTEGDFFENGMDSLQAVQLSRFLGSGIQRLDREKERRAIHISADFIYRNPSIKMLAAETTNLINQGIEIKNAVEGGRAKKMETLAAEYWALSGCQVALPSIGRTILMTGSTGGLGAHTLARLTRMGTVDKVICLIRGQRLSASNSDSEPNGEKTESILFRRQRNALEAAGIFLEPKEWEKIELLELASIMEQNEMSKAYMYYLSAQVTHILHLAWPMDFQRRLESFKPHIKLLQTLVNLAELAFTMQSSKQPIRLLFSSSIAVARYYKNREAKNGNRHSGRIVPESSLHDPLASTPMGYAEAKWVGETYLDHVAKHLLGTEPVVVRIGQLSGPEKTSGRWRAEEHIPTMVRASQIIGAFPDLKGAPTASWMPVDRAAFSLGEILMHKGRVDRFLHLENPVRQPLKDIFAIMAHEMHLQHPFMVPFEQWLRRVTMAGEIRSLEGFFNDHFQELACGGVRLDTTRARAVSNCLMQSGALEKELIIEYVHRWQRNGVLK